ncbi:uncharacterized protein LOC125872381 [Solanum stenotomum]|uniref:uncharacterized protein LOC125872381 n=1 Tax=Solanum stenotomum TaxID=172797 RepID=UPI0020D0E315|nr:uncharacterized protein LOC125872381 [Solanum stenotomum]
MAIRMRQNLPEYNHIPSVHYFYCRRCRTQVAIIHYIPTLRILTRVYIRRFRVEVAEDEPQHRVTDGMTLILAETNCVQCRSLLMWKIIAVSQPSNVYRVGGFIMRLNAFISWNNVTLFDLLFGGNNAQAPNDQDGGADEEQNHDHNGGPNEQNADQNQVEDPNEQSADQVVGANEQNADEHGGGNEQNHDQDGGPPTKRMKT